ncbi:MAG: hypothetical protein IPP31_06650 [Chitinophagaceae bacterium]|nr:hypothetical protein [Chitinophagaceae bacterium]
MMHKGLFFILLGLFCLPQVSHAQTVAYADFDREDSKDISFEIIGKMNDHILVYKNIRWKHKLSIYDQDMRTRETVMLDFIPEKTVNVDFITYPDFFYIIYQYQKRSILHCMAVKLDGNGKKLSEPVEMDTTQISLMADNKIYSTINSEDKKKIMVFKMQKKWDRFNIVTLLFDDQLKLIRKTREVIPFDERRDSYGDFLLDNEGNLVFSIDKQEGYRENSGTLNLVTKAPASDSFVFHPINLNNKFVDDVKLKIDNLNKRYIIASFYYPKSRGSIEGLFTCTWDRTTGTQNPSAFNVFDPYLRADAKSDGLQRFAFDDYYIRQIFVKKDGSFLVAAEDYSSQTSSNSNSWNRWDYLNNPNALSSNSYYYYSPYSGYYRPYNRYNNFQSTRFYYANIMVLSVDKSGLAEWAKVIQKDQFEDNDDSYLSYSTMNSGGEIHFIFSLNSGNQVITDQSLAPDGTIKRNATLKSRERGYQFMSKFGKQVGARQLIIPCTYRGNISFAKVDF